MLMLLHAGAGPATRPAPAAALPDDGVGAVWAAATTSSADAGDDGFRIISPAPATDDASAAITAAEQERIRALADLAYAEGRMDSCTAQVLLTEAAGLLRGARDAWRSAQGPAAVAYAQAALDLIGMAQLDMARALRRDHLPPKPGSAGAGGAA